MSINNAQLRWVKSLAKKSARVESGRFFAEGSQSLKVLARKQYWLEKIYVTEDFMIANKNQIAEFNPDLIEEISPEQIQRMADANTPQGVLAICKLPSKQPSVSGSPLVMLEQVSDPGNLGTIIRTADASGAGTIMIGEGSADVFSPKVVRSSAGSIFNVDLMQSLEMDAAIEEVQGLGYQVFAADTSGSDFRDGDYSSKHSWLLGNEAHGLGSELRAKSNKTFSLPIAGEAESLNLSVAAGILLYHSAFSQQG